jgi:hypothetical protein
MLLVLSVALLSLLRPASASADEQPYCEAGACYAQQKGVRCSSGNLGARVVKYREGGKPDNPDDIIETTCEDDVEVHTDRTKSSKCQNGQIERWYKEGVGEIEKPAVGTDMTGVTAKCEDPPVSAPTALNPVVRKEDGWRLNKTNFQTDWWEKRANGFNLGILLEFTALAYSQTVDGDTRLNPFSKTRFLLQLVNNFHRDGAYLQGGVEINNSAFVPDPAFIAAAGFRRVMSQKIRSYWSAGAIARFSFGNDRMYMGMPTGLPMYGKTTGDINLGIQTTFDVAIDKRLLIGTGLDIMIWNKDDANDAVVVGPNWGYPTVMFKGRIVGMPF